ncbi:MAG: hypothetical protein H6834_08175 [Planctomycetes bacterium]|nr:hypothetical protein [Planctomycetota bacterium]
MITRTLFLLASTTLVACTQTPSPVPRELVGEALGAFTLRDQEDVERRYPGTSERPVLLIHGDSDTVESNTDWDHWTSGAFGDALIVHRVVNLESVPGPFQFVARRRIREGADPPGIPILLDWNGELARRLALPAKRTTLLVVDAAGHVVGRIEGPRTAEGEAKLRELVARTRHANIGGSP